MACRAKRFNKRDLLDLQCWSNLTWIHPIAFEIDPNLAEFRRKGKHWTEAEKQWLRRAMPFITSKQGFNQEPPHAP